MPAIDDPTHSPARPRHLVRTTLLGLLILAGIVLVAGSITAHRSLSQATQQARSLGLISFKELEAARRNWPADQDAAPAFTRIADAFDAQDKKRTPADRDAEKPVPIVGETEPDPLGHLWPASTQQAAWAYIVRMGPFYEDLDGLRKFPGGKIPLQPKENPMEILLPNLSQLRRATKLECLAIQREAVAGSVDDLSARLEVLDRLRSLASDQPVLISALVTAAEDALLCDTLERALALNAIRPEDFATAQKVLRVRVPHDSTRLGLLGERAIFMETAQAIRSGKIDMRELNLVYARLPLVSFVFMKDYAYGVRLHNRLIAASDDPLKLLAAAKTVEQQLQSTPAWAIYTRTAMASFTRAIQLSVNTEAILRTTRVGLATEQYRLDHGDFPQKLSDLAPQYLPEVPKDPFDLQPLRFKKMSECVLVYSIGVNGRDDGGLKPASRRSADDSDTVFTVLAPANRRLPPANPASQPGHDRARRR